MDTAEEAELRYKRLEYWVLQELGSPKCYAFANKHLALESLERTYRKEIENQSYQIDWNVGHTHAVITVLGLQAYHLGISTVDAHAIPTTVRRHPDISMLPQQIQGQLSALAAGWSRLNLPEVLDQKETVELQNTISSTEALIRRLIGK